MKKCLYVVLTFVTIALVACKNEPYKTPPPSPSASYFPQTYGSTWRYRDSIFGETTDTVNLFGVRVDTLSVTIKGGTTDFNGYVTYNAGIQSKVYGPQQAYYFSGNHVAAIFETNPPWGFTELDILTDTASVGYSWINGPTLNNRLNGSPVQAVNKIVEKNITRTVGGQTFANVTHTVTNFQINVNGSGFRNIANFDFYVAQGIGLIEKDAFYYSYLNEKETIIDYSIGPNKK